MTYFIDLLEAFRTKDHKFLEASIAKIVYKSMLENHITRLTISINGKIHQFEDLDFNDPTSIENILSIIPREDLSKDIYFISCHIYKSGCCSVEIEDSSKYRTVLNVELRCC